MNDIFVPKIMYSEIVKKPQFYLDNLNLYPEASTFIITGKNIEKLCIFLNSKLMAYIFKQFYAGGGLGSDGYRYKKKFLLNLPIPNKVFFNKEDISVFFTEKKFFDNELLSKIENLIAKSFSLSNEELEYIALQIND